MQHLVLRLLPADDSSNGASSSASLLRQTLWTLAAEDHLRLARSGLRDVPRFGHSHRALALNVGQRKDKVKLAVRQGPV